ncbi:E3 ubiquitin-protein ligase RMA3-like [Malania oleifera]|uniref:E3 ubiquitin-protein ligase RMA3-like n=1 Tax=Malania oleifera TaxID=397392 RepID=UPI0025AD9E7E|nr:E3 ubiquitin-protein ligase RMA3-like [Malania oleifera]
MALEHNFVETMAQFDDCNDVSLKQKWKNISDLTPAAENSDGCFDCNICLDSAHDPVVTLCGHLFCWPCIYKWLNVQTSSPDIDHQQKCPVCKADVSPTSLVPLYGRGLPSSESKKPDPGVPVPRRPAACGLHTLITTTSSSPTNTHRQHLHDPFHSQSFHHQQYFPHPYGSYNTASSNLGGVALPSVFSPTVGMFGEMVYARIFGGSDASLFSYPHQNSYPPMGSSSPRMRRQEIQVDKSLNRVSIFLFCCFVLCLLLF